MKKSNCRTKILSLYFIIVGTFKLLNPLLKSLVLLQLFTKLVKRSVSKVSKLKVTIYSDSLVYSLRRCKLNPLEQIQFFKFKNELFWLYLILHWFSCVQQIFVSSCPDFCAFTRLSCVQPIFVRSCLDFRKLDRIRAFMSRRSCVPLICLRSPGFSEFMSRLLSVQQIFMRSCLCFRAFNQIYLRSPCFPAFMPRFLCVHQTRVRWSNFCPFKFRHQISIQIEVIFNVILGGWWQSKSALNQSKNILFFRMANTLFMSQFTLTSLIFEQNLRQEK